MLARRRGIVIALLALLAIGVLAAVGLGLRDSDPEGPAGPDDFRVDANRLLDPDGQPFVIRGVVMPYGTFFADGYDSGVSATNAQRFAADAERVRAAGANLVRVFVMRQALAPERFAELERVVKAARAKGLVVQLSGAFATFADAEALVKRLAERWAGDPYVWIQPMNEPQCANDEDLEAGRCEDWRLWRVQHTAYLRTIRAAGVTSPVVVNGPAYSTDLSQLGRYRLADPQVLYGAHRYGNTYASFDAEERASVERAIAAPSRRFPVFVDEFGNFNGEEFPNDIAWSSGMATWAADWIGRGEGLGATGFNWRWSDANTMVDGADRLTPWGEAFSQTILARR